MSELKSPVRNISPEEIEREEEKTSIKSSKIFDPKNYLNVRLEDNEESKELKVRILPINKDSNSPFEHIYMHSIKVPKEISKSGFKSYVCLEKTEGPFSEKLGHKCPFCERQRELYQEMLKATDEANKKLFKDTSKALKAYEIGISRWIERGHEEDGPKFWKYTLRTDKKDPENTIKSIYKTRKEESIEEAMDENNGTLPEDFIPENILDLETGKDLKVTINSADNGKTSVTITDYGKNKPLGNEENIEKWVNDPKVWSDVFVAKPYEYLKIVMDGGVPYYSKAEGKWITKEEFSETNDNAKKEKASEMDEDIRKAEENAKKESEPIHTEKVKVEKVTDDDLPF